MSSEDKLLHDKMYAYHEHFSGDLQYTQQPSSSMWAAIKAGDNCVYRGLEQAETGTEDRLLSLPEQ